LCYILIVQGKFWYTKLCNKTGDNTIFVDYDLMMEKCENCTSKRPDETECFKGKDIFFCTKNALHYNEERCLCCFENFCLQNVDYEQYFIYALTGVDG